MYFVTTIQLKLENAKQCKTQTKRVEHNEFRIGTTDIDVFYFLKTIGGRSVGHARSSHSILFQPDDYKTCAKLKYFLQISLFV